MRIDWTERKSVQARLKIEVKKTLKHYDYPPDQQKIATDILLEQAKRCSKEWSNQLYKNSADLANIFLIIFYKSVIIYNYEKIEENFRRKNLFNHII